MHPAVQQLVRGSLLGSALGVWQVWWVGTCTAFSLRVSFSSWLERVEKSFQKLSPIHVQNCILHFSRAKRVVYACISGQSDLLMLYQMVQLFLCWCLFPWRHRAVILNLLSASFSWNAAGPLIFFPQAWQTALPSGSVWGVLQSYKTQLICWKGGFWALAIFSPFLPCYPVSLVWPFSGFLVFFKCIWAGNKAEQDAMVRGFLFIYIKKKERQMFL